MDAWGLEVECWTNDDGEACCDRSSPVCEKPIEEPLIGPVEILTGLGGIVKSAGGKILNTGIKIAPNPFKGKSFQQIDKMFDSKKFVKKGPDPLRGKGSYVNPNTGTRYYLDKGGMYKKGYESPHVDIWYKKHPSYEKTKYFLDGSCKQYK